LLCLNQPYGTYSRRGLLAKTGASFRRASGVNANLSSRSPAAGIDFAIPTPVAQNNRRIVYHVYHLRHFIRDLILQATPLSHDQR
jgi:hypothetical protein